MNGNGGTRALKRPIPALLVAFSAVALALVAGCGGGGGTQEKVVARAGDITVTLAEFHAAYTAITPTFRPDISTLEGKRSFANDLVNGRIMVVEGDRMGGITEPSLLDHFESTRRTTMLRLLYQDEVINKVEVLGSDVKELYDHRKVNVRASHILVNSEEAATRIRAEIVSGEITFAAAAEKYSMDQGTRQSGGSLGEVRWGRTVPAFQRLAFEMEPGDLSEPLETTFGWHLVTVEERVEVEMVSLDEMRPVLRKEARQQMEAERMREFVSELEVARNLTWHDDALEELRESIRVMTTFDIDTIPPVEQHIPPVPEADRGDAIATWDGGQWTKGDYIEAMRSQPPRARPPKLIPSNGMKELIRTAQVQEQILVAEAEARGYGEKEEVTGAADRLREQVLVETVHGRFIQAADVTDEDAMALYDSTLTATPDVLLVPERVDMLIVTHAEKVKIEEALRRMKAGEDEAVVILEISLDGRTSSQGGRTGLIPRGNYAPQVEEVAFSGRVGKGWSGPIFTETGTGAVKVLVQEEPRTATFEEVKDTLIRNLATGRGEQAFEDWLDEERAKRKVEIFDEVLELYGQSITP